MSSLHTLCHLSLSGSILKGLQLADPDFGCPGRIDLLLRVVFVDALLTGRQFGQFGTPTTFETHFGWVLAGSVEGNTTMDHLVSYHLSLSTSDDVFCRFWEIKDSPLSDVRLSPDERSVVQHFGDSHSRASTGRFIIPLLKKKNVQPLGESRSQAVRRFLLLERTLLARRQFDRFDEVMSISILVMPIWFPSEEINAPTSEVFYMPMHAVHKQSSTMTKIRAVFNAPMKSATGISLNDILMAGPTVHSQLVDILIRFRMHRIALVEN